MKTCRTIQVFVISATVEQTGIIIKDSAKASKKATPGERGLDLEIQGWGTERTQRQIREMAKFSVRGKTPLVKSKETWEGMKHFSCWGRMAPRVTTHQIWHAWARSLSQENSAASEGKTRAGCCGLLPSAPPCIFIKYPGSGTVKATFCLSRESTEKAAHNKQGWLQWNWNYTKLYCQSKNTQLVGYTGWTASGRVPKTPLAGTCASSWGSVSRSKGTMDNWREPEGQQLLQQSRAQKYQGVQLTHMGSKALHCSTAWRGTETSLNICSKQVFVGEWDNGKIHTSRL